MDKVDGPVSVVLLEANFSGFHLQHERTERLLHVLPNARYVDA